MHLGENYKENNLNLPEKIWEKGKSLANVTKIKTKRNLEMEI